MLGCHGHWSSLWLTGHFSSTNLICIWDCHTSTLVSNLPQHTRHSLCWLDTAQITLLFEWLWAYKPGISVLPPPLPALGDRYPEGVSRSQKPDVLYCQKTVRDKLANTCTRMPSMLSAFFDALQLFDFYSWFSTCYWVTETVWGFSVNRFSIPWNGRGQLMMLCTVSVWTGFGRGQATGLASGKNC